MLSGLVKAKGLEPGTKYKVQGTRPHQIDSLLLTKVFYGVVQNLNIKNSVFYVFSNRFKLMFTKLRLSPLGRS